MDHTDGAASVPRRRLWRRAVTTAAASLIAAGVALTLCAWLLPEQTQEAYGVAQETIGQAKANIARAFPGTRPALVPTVRLAGAGGLAQLNWCTGDFFHMTSYTHPGVPPVWAAHNDCRGDVVLPLRVGDPVRLVSGTRDLGVWDVVDLRHTPKVWVTTKALIGLKGVLALQSCFFGDHTVPMDFAGLDPAPGNRTTLARVLEATR